jgi:hypothetical protein
MVSVRNPYKHVYFTGLTGFFGGIMTRKIGLRMTLIIGATLYR